MLLSHLCYVYMPLSQVFLWPLMSDDIGLLSVVAGIMPCTTGLVLGDILQPKQSILKSCKITKSELQCAYSRCREGQLPRKTSVARKATKTKPGALLRLAGAAASQLPESAVTPPSTRLTTSDTANMFNQAQYRILSLAEL
uniref:Secreted protein n=2 Tax=Macrostomum lignano TaxID=282301 RepID=A0A1I8HJD0_9PLAT